MRFKTIFLSLLMITAGFFGISNTTQNIKADAGGPDAYGYTWIDSNAPAPEITYSWVDGVTPGSLMGPWDEPTWIDDSFAGSIPIGFSFSFYGFIYTDIFVSSNGYMSFGTGYFFIPLNPIPDPFPPNFFIMPLGSDLDPKPAGDITEGCGNIYYWSDTLSSPNRFVITFDAVCNYDSLIQKQTFEVILYENLTGGNGEILFQYETLINPIMPIVGIENWDGSIGLPYPSALSNNLAVKFIPPTTPPPPPPSDTLTVEAWDRAPSGVEAGLPQVLLMQLNLTAGPGDVALSSIRIDLSGLPPTSNDISSAELWHDVDSNDIFELTIDSIVSGMSFSPPPCPCYGTFSFFFPWTITGGTTSIFFIIYNIETIPQATVGDWIGASIVNETYISVAPPDNVAPFVGIDTYVPTVRTEITAPTSQSLLVEAWDRAPATVEPGQSGVLMLQLNLSVDAPTGFINLNNFTLNLSGVPPTSDDVFFLFLYRDGNGNEIFERYIDPVIAFSFFSPPPCPCSAIISPMFPLAIIAGTTTRLFVVYYISPFPLATIGDWIGVSIANETFFNVGAPDTVAPFGGVDTYVVGVRTEIILPTWESLMVEAWDRAPANANTSQAQVLMLQLNLSVGAPTGIIILNSIRIDLSGFPPTSNDISSAVLWLDANWNDAFEPSIDMPITSEVFSPPPCPCSLTFSLFGVLQIEAGSSTQLFVTYNINNTPPATIGNWIGASIADETYISVEPLDDLAAFAGIDTYVPDVRTLITSSDNPPTIEAWEPGGSPGQTYTQGDLIDITWTATDDNPWPNGGNVVNISYGPTPAGGTAIANNEFEDGIFPSWDTSLVLPGSYYINITVYDSVGQQSGASSNSSFDLVVVDNPPTIEVWEPGGTASQIYIVRELIDITWLASDDNPWPNGGNVVNISYGPTPAGGTVIANDEFDDGVYPSWDTSLVIPGSYYMNITVYDSTGQQSGNNSNFSFDIVVDDPPVIEVWEPGGTSGQIYTVGDLIDITWVASDDNLWPNGGNIVNISYGATSAGGIVVANNEFEDGVYPSWDTSSAAPGTYYINITVYDSAGQQRGAKSNFSFDILADNPPEIEAWEPGGTSGKIYTQGDLITVTWIATDDNLLPLNPINITYGDPISGWTSIVTGVANDGTYSWDTSGVPCPSTYLMNLSVYDSVGQTTFDAGNYSFDINCPVSIGNITGTVVDLNDDPLEGATVKLYDSGDNFIDTVTTDADGEFKFENVPFGAYIIKILKSGFESQTIDANLQDTTLDVGTIKLKALQEFPWWILIVVLAVIIIILLLAIAMRKKKKPEEEKAEEVEEDAVELAEEIPKEEGPE